MIRIGFDPMLDAEQRNQVLIKEVELYRMAQEGMPQHQPRVGSRFRLLAMLGKEMVSLGASLEARYGDKPDWQDSMNTQSNPDGCSS